MPELSYRRSGGRGYSLSEKLKGYLWEKIELTNKRAWHTKATGSHEVVVCEWAL